MKRLLVLLLCAAGPLRAADTGALTGHLAGTNAVLAVTAVSRADEKRFAGTFDPATRRFRVAGLPLEKDLDCIIDWAGARLEGVNFRVPRSDYEEEQPLSPPDAQVIRDRALAMNRFEDLVDVLAVEGNRQHAAVLLNKRRTQSFVNSQPGEMIWRVELWHYERPEEDWVRCQEDFGVLYRERIPHAQFAKKAVTFDPVLGGLRLTAAQSTIELGEITPPVGDPGIRFRDGRKKL